MEKRVNSYKDVLDFFDNLSQKMQLNNGKEAECIYCSVVWTLNLPHGKLLQYSDAFSTPEKFQSFFNGFELVITNNKPWFDKKVIRHLNLMQGYFAQINALRVLIRRISAPLRETLTEEDWK